MHNRHIGDESGSLATGFDTKRVVDILEVGRVVSGVEAAKIEELVPPQNPTCRRRVVHIPSECLAPVATTDLGPTHRRRTSVVIEQLAGFLQRTVRVRRGRAQRFRPSDRRGQRRAVRANRIGRRHPD